MENCMIDKINLEKYFRYIKFLFCSILTIIITFNYFIKKVIVIVIHIHNTFFNVC